LDLIKSLRQVRTFCNDVSLLLREAKNPLESKGLKLKVAPLFRDTSSDLKSALKWFPPYACCFYQGPSSATWIAYLAVVWDYPDQPELLTEPLVTAGLVDYAPGHPNLTAVQKNGNPQFLHLYMPDRVDDGTIVTSSAAMLKKFRSLARGGMANARLTTLAVPLVDIPERKVLISRVISPLLGVLDEQPI
jgi:hypothetical protein